MVGRLSWRPPLWGRPRRLARSAVETSARPRDGSGVASSAEVGQSGPRYRPALSFKTAAIVRLLHVAASSGHQTARIAPIQTTSSGVFVPILARWPAAYGHRLTRRQRRLSINIPPELNEGRKALRLRCGRQTPTVLAWLAPSIIGTGVMPCAIITIAAYGKFSCPVLVQVSYSSSQASKARSSRDSESQHPVHRRPF
jgi:hypothetical protein